MRFGIDALIRWGIALTIVGCLINVAVYAAFPGWELATIFLPQLIIGFGNGLLLPTAVAGAVSIRPQVAGTASGMTGFVQMTIGAARGAARRPCRRRAVERDADAAADAVFRRAQPRWRVFALVRRRTAEDGHSSDAAESLEECSRYRAAIGTTISIDLRMHPE